MTDNAFSSRWLGALDVTMRAYHEVSERLERLTIIEVVRVALPYHDGFARDRMLDAFVEGHRAGARQGWREADGEGADLRGRLRRLEEAAAADMLTVEHEGGGVSRFHQDAVVECFLHEVARGRRHSDGEAPQGEADDAHPLTVALRTAADLEDLMKRNGTIMGLFVGEDEILRGVRPRPGPTVERNKDGTVCS